MAEKCLNTHQMIGRLGADPERRETAAGMVVVTASIGTTSYRRTTDGRESSRVEWHRVVFFGRLGEIAAQYLRKGTRVHVTSELRYERYTDSSGATRNSTSLVANDLVILTQPAEAAQNGKRSEARERTQPQEERRSSQAAVESRQAPVYDDQEHASRTGLDDWIDDVAAQGLPALGDMAAFTADPFDGN